MNPTATTMQKARIAVIGGGPVGASVARALAQCGCGTIHWFEANHPVEGDFSRRSMSCPWAAGQVLANSFEPDTLAAQLGQRTLQVLRQMGERGQLPMQPRPWLACAPKHGGPVGEATRTTLDAAWNAGRMEGFTRIHGPELARFQGLRANEIDFALCDESTLAVDPRDLAIGLAKLAAHSPGVSPHFGAVVESIQGNEITATQNGVSLLIHADVIVLCVGIHVAGLLINGAPLHTLVPPTTITHLHVFDHRSAEHTPQVNYCLAGPATIARYEIFGEPRKQITPDLPSIAQAFDINPLLTDVPGLCRLLDTHFATQEEAALHTPKARDEIAALLGEYIEPQYLPGNPAGSVITDSTIASYVKHIQPDGEPTIQWLNTKTPVLYVQPSNGRGVTQSVGIGEYAVDLLRLHLD